MPHAPRVVVAGEDRLTVELLTVALDRLERFDVVSGAPGDDLPADVDVGVVADGAPAAWRQIRERGVPVVVAVGERPVAVEDEIALLLRGADAVIALDDDSTEVAERISLVAGGGSSLEADRLRVLLELVREGRQPWQGLAEPLTVREGEILRSIDRGESVKQTARSLGISPKTVENLQSRLFRKLGVRNRAQAVLRAYELGIIETAVETAVEAEDAGEDG
jgi:DNA-binding NarL/FixJ family response regulator